MRINTGIAVLLLSLAAAACGTGVDDSTSSTDSAVTQHAPVTLDGLTNFRDLGGRTTADGKRVKLGQVFRSEALVALTDPSQIARARLEQVIDFRSDEEKDGAQDPIAQSLVVALPVVDDVRERDVGIVGGRLLGRLFAATTDEEKRAAAAGLDAFLPTDTTSPTLMNSAYRGFVTGTSTDTSAGNQFHKFVRAVASGKRTLFHCVSGKDRTGFAAAIILRAIGVSKDEVMKDYLLSFDAAHAAKADAFVAAMRAQGWTHADRFLPLLTVRPEYLNAALDQIEQSYGRDGDDGIANYFESIQPGLQQKLVRVLTEAPADATGSD